MPDGDDIEYTVPKPHVLKCPSVEETQDSHYAYFHAIITIVRRGMFMSKKLYYIECKFENEF